MFKTSTKFIAAVMLSVCGLVYTGCADKAVEPPAEVETPTDENVEEKLEIPEDKLSFEFDHNRTNFEVYVTTNLTVKQWSATADQDWITIWTKRNSASQSTIGISVKENDTDQKRVARVTVATESGKISHTITILQYANSKVEVEGDIRVMPIDAKADQYQSSPYQHISCSYDDDFNTCFHSPWNSTQLPVTLEYFFSGEEPIDYVVYYGYGNGSFGELDVYVAEDAAHQNYEHVGNYDFGKKNTPSSVNLPSGKKPTAVKFVVKSGYNNLVSCQEMWFYRTNTEKTLDNKLLTVFTDITCTELKDGVTDEQIEDLGEYFSRLARMIRDNTYDEYEKEFRIREYAAYSNNNAWAEKLQTNAYTDLDNPTGIAVRPGDELLILVGDTHGNTISIECIGEEICKHEKGNYVQPACNGETFQLRTGVNKIKVNTDGQLFILYNLNDILAPNALPIKIHIPYNQGTVTGFFDIDEHKTDKKYGELLAKASHKYFCVRGHSFMFYFHRSKMPSSKITGAVELWDNIAEWEQEFCGVDEYRGEGKPYNNHMFGMSPEANNGQMFLWASQYRMAFIYTVLWQIVVDTNTMLQTPEPIWGPAHEMGHMHQEPINFVPCTELSVNVFAHYIQERHGKYTSRGPGLMYLAKVKADIEDCTWWDVVKAGDPYQCIANRMYWQLYLYYQKLGNRPDFWRDVFKEMRKKGLKANGDPGKKQMEFVKTCCDVAGEDLTEFFDLWGFFLPYTEKDGSTRCAVTQPMINSCLNYIQQYPKPKQAFQYIEDRKAVGYLNGEFDRATIGDLGFYETFDKNLKLSSDISATISGRNVKVSNANEAVAFEVRKGSETGDIVFFSNFLDFKVAASVDITNCHLYAVQADGTRKKLGSF